jgi:hypothetical protein
LRKTFAHPLGNLSCRSNRIASKETTAGAYSSLGAGCVAVHKKFAAEYIILGHVSPALLHFLS